MRLRTRPFRKRNGDANAVGYRTLPHPRTKEKKPDTALSETRNSTLDLVHPTQDSLSPSRDLVISKADTIVVPHLCYIRVTTVTLSRHLSGFVVSL